MYLFDWRECWEGTDFFRNRTYPFDTDIRWWINFQVILIQTRRNCDHNWIHWFGNCDQQSHRFLKLTPLLHVSLSYMVFASGGSFQDVCGELIGLGKIRPVQRPLLSRTICGERFRCPSLSKKRKSRRKSQNQQNSQCSRRPTATSRQKARQSASSSWGHLQCIVGIIMDFPDFKTRTSD